MAYLNNNDNPHTSGDPLGDLDRELAELKKTLGALESSDPVPEDKPEQTPEPVEKTPDVPDKSDEEEPDTEEPDDDEPAEEAPQPAREVQTNMAKAPKQKKCTPLIVILVILTTLLLLGIAFGVLRILRNAQTGDTGSTAATAGGEVVTINDSVMGDIELKTVKGAEISTLTKDNLTTDENGFYAYYQDGEKISHIGIDLSSYQTDVDFNALKESGIEFVMLRIGGRFYADEGEVYDDTAFDDYYQKATAAGLKVGAYFFSQAASPEDAVEEAEAALKKLNGRHLDYPVAFDWENIADDAARTDNVTGDQLTDIAEAFCDTINNAGYKSIIYANSHQMFILYDFETMKDYDFWLADYRDFPTMYYNFDMWQYATDGKVNGVEGDVDLNISFTDF